MYYDCGYFLNFENLSEPQKQQQQQPSMLLLHNITFVLVLSLLQCVCLPLKLIEQKHTACLQALTGVM